jgi:hypothetical protein
VLTRCVAACRQGWEAASQQRRGGRGVNPASPPPDHISFFLVFCPVWCCHSFSLAEPGDSFLRSEISCRARCACPSTYPLRCAARADPLWRGADGATLPLPTLSRTVRYPSDIPPLSPADFSCQWPAQHPDVGRPGRRGSASAAGILWRAGSRPRRYGSGRLGTDGPDGRRTRRRRHARCWDSARPGCWLFSGR